MQWQTGFLSKNIKNAASSGVFGASRKFWGLTGCCTRVYNTCEGGCVRAGRVAPRSVVPRTSAKRVFCCVRNASFLWFFRTQQNKYTFCCVRGVGLRGGRPIQAVGGRNRRREAETGAGRPTRRAGGRYRHREGGRAAGTETGRCLSGRYRGAAGFVAAASGGKPAAERNPNRKRGT